MELIIIIAITSYAVLAVGVSKLYREAKNKMCKEEWVVYSD